MEYSVLYKGNLERIISLLFHYIYIFIYFEKWSESDFIDVDSNRSDGGILYIMVFMDLEDDLKSPK